MKSEIRMALLVLASASAPTAFAQDIPQCATFFDNSQQFFTAAGTPDGALNRQCFLTVMPKDGPSSVADFPNLAQYPQPQLMEGTYEIILSGGGGGGGGGGLLASGGGGAGAVPFKTQTYLSPGVYKLTLGTGGRGGPAGFMVGGSGEAGAPTSMTKAYTNETVAGFRGADTWARAPRDQSYMVASSRNVPAPGPDGVIADGQGARGVNGMGSGGNGGILPARDEDGRRRAERPAQDGAPMPVAGIPTGQPGRGGPRDGGGGGGAGYGNGGDGKSIQTASSDFQSGQKGGEGFVKLVPVQLAQAAPAPVAAPAQAEPAPFVAPHRAKRDRN